MKKITILLALIAVNIYGLKAQNISQSSTQYNGNIFHMGGNVGIGTTNPFNRLDVVGNYSASAQLRVGYSNTNSGLFFASQASSSHYNWRITTQSSVDGGFEIARSASNGGVDWQAPSFVIKNGSVGIGTTAPYGKLHVFSQNSPSQYYDGELHVGGFIGHSEDITLIIGTHYTNKTTFLQGWRAGSGSTPILLQPQGGNVGIGTTTPLTKLHIEGSSANWNETIPGLAPGTIHLSTGNTNDHYGNAITWGASDANGAQAGIYTRSDGSYGTKMYFATTDSYVTGSKTRMFIGANGNVGIGTTAPTSVFEVNKDINDIWTTSIKNGGGSSKGLSIEVGYGGDNASTIMQLGDANGNTRATFKSNGNVGIGTTNPQYKLAVEGTIAAREIKVTAESWADFVFHPTYKLRTLGEVEQFIKTNSHLPEIPTAAEVKENGVDLGEMNAKLLQKVEELTLYLIEQNKKMDQQQKIIEKQNLRIEKLEKATNK